MEYVGIESVKKAYRDLLQNNGKYEEASAVNRKEFTDPLYEGLTVHAETEPNLDIINDALQRIAVDIAALNLQYGSVAELFDELMTEVLTDLTVVDEVIEKEKERIQDLSIISGNMSYFSGVKTFSASDLSGTCSIQDDYTFMCHSTDRTNVNITVEDVLGNGYEGNKYVYTYGIFEQDVSDTSLRNNMIDSFSNSFWEYSRLSVPKSTTQYPIDANFDNKEAECTILISSDSTFNSLRLQSDIDNLSVEQISISEDGGITYQDTMEQPISVLDTAKKYEDDSYIYGSGLLCFPATAYIKIRLKSNGVLNEQFAFSKITFVNDQDSEESQKVETTILLPGAQRHVIRVNDIIAFTSTFDTESYLETEQLISSPVDCIAIFANEYYPPTFPSDASIYGLQDYLTYIMTINGKEYNMVPVNSHKTGTKIIRFSNYSITENYSVHIDEPIKSATLKVKFITPDQSYSPYLSNLKVCLGKAVVS